MSVLDSSLGPVTLDILSDLDKDTDVQSHTHNTSGIQQGIELTKTATLMEFLF